MKPIMPNLPGLSSKVSAEIRAWADKTREFFGAIAAQGGFITRDDMVKAGLMTAAKEQHLEVPDQADDRLPMPLNLDLVEQLYSSLVNAPSKSQAIFLSRIIADWNTAGSLAVGYEAELWQGSTLLKTVTTAALTCQFDGLEAGSYTVKVRTLGAFNLRSQYETASIVVLGKTAEPSPPEAFAVYVEDVYLKLVWVEPDSEVDPDIAGYILKQGTDWNNPVKTVTVGRTTEFRWAPSQAGTLDFMLKSLDTSGLESLTYRTATITLRAPGTVPGLSQQVIDNNVLLKWGAATKGDYPIVGYEVRRGADFATAAVIGTTPATFSVIFETQSGTYKYWVNAIDSAGLAITNPLQIASAYATVNQPPDYVLLADQDISLSTGTAVNALTDANDSLLLLVNTTIAWEDHFQSNPDTALEPWSTPQDQIDDGFPVFAQPPKTTASYEKVIDYQAVLSSGKITFDVTRSLVQDGGGSDIGSVTVTPALSYSADNVTYSTPENVYETYASNFRYVKYRIDVTGADGALLVVSRLHSRIDAKRKSLEGRATITGGVGSKTIYLTTDGTNDANKKVFADVDAITVTAKIGTGSVALSAFYDFTDTPNPLDFTAYVRRTDDGSVFASDCEVSWVVRGV